jgi:branched-chain amino acid transport system substrate-binding protein
MRCARSVLAAAGLIVASVALAQAPPVTPPATPPPTLLPAEKKPALPTVRLGAILPLSGPAGWFGKEMRQGMELAMGELNRPRPEIPRADRLDGVPGEDQKATAAAERAGDQGVPSPGVTLALDAADVAPLDVRRARDEFARLAALPVLAVFTATAGPTVTLQPLAAGRDILLVHQGVVTDRFAAGSRTLLHTRPSVATQVERLLAHLAVRTPRRLAILAGGDDFGRTVRATAGARWRERGGHPIEESLNLEGPDLAARIRQVVRAAPDAIVLGFRGPELGDVAARLREARYAGPLYCLDDDRSARLAGGVALEGAVVVTDAFVPELGTEGERFAEVYRKQHGGLPSRYAAHAYDAVMMIAEVIRQTKGVPGGTRLRETLGRLRAIPSVYGSATTLRDDGTLVGPLPLFTIDQGELAFVRYLAPPAGRS